MARLEFHLGILDCLFVDEGELPAAATPCPAKDVVSNRPFFYDFWLPMQSIYLIVLKDS